MTRTLFLAVGLALAVLASLAGTIAQRSSLDRAPSPRPSLTIDADTLADMKAALMRREGPPIGARPLVLGRYSQLSDADALSNLFQPRTDVAPYQLTYPLDWNIDPFEDRNWRFQLHGWRSVGPSIVAFERTGDGVYADHIVAAIADWDRYHYAERRMAKFSWDDMAAANRALVLAFVLDRWRTHPNLIADGEGEMLLRLAAGHIEKLRDPNYLKNNNHGIFQTHGLMALCRVLEGWPPCEEKRIYAGDTMLAFARDQFAEDGAHREHSPSYHFFALSTFKRLITSGWYDSVPEIVQRISRADAAAAWLVDARGRVPNIGDSETTSPNTGQVSAGRCEGRPAPCLVTQLFPETGYAHVRTAPGTPPSDAMSMFLTCSFHSSVHKHDDDLSLEWVASGEAILTDSGKLTYSETEERGFVLNRRAHSSIEFHGFPTAPAARAPYGGCLDRAQIGPDGIARASGALTYRNGAVTHAREVSIDSPTTLRVTDRVEGRPRGGYTLWWHFDPAFESVAEGAHTFSARSEQLQLTVMVEPKICISRLIRGQRSPEIQGWVSESYGSLTPRWSVGARCPREVERITTLFAVSKRADGDVSHVADGR